MNLNKKILEKVKDGRVFRNMTEFRIAENEEEQCVVSGHACTFNQPYILYEDKDYKIIEIVDSRAFDGCDMSDVIMQYNHEGRVYARTRNNTLAVTIDAVGLAIRAVLGGTEAGIQLYKEIKDGYTDRMSFGFRVSEDERVFSRNLDTNQVTITRTITKISKVYDVSAVSIPANDGTDISARSFCDGLIAELEAERLESERKATELRRMQEETLALLNL